VTRRWLPGAIVVCGCAGTFLLATASMASAHPLGNFTVNHYDGLVAHPDRVEDTAVIDTAEIPTAQERASVDTNGDGHVSDAERAAYAVRRCAALAGALELRADGRPAPWRVAASDFGYRPGAAGLQTSRLTCQLTVPLDLGRRARITFVDGFAADRVGWHEITAAGSGVHLDASPVPTRSVSDELRRYPNDLLSAPLDVRSAELAVLPGAGVSTLAHDIATVPGAGPLARSVDWLNRSFTSLVGARHLTLAVGLAALALALLLGASHAALPGHGKTVMAAYIAGRRGTPRGALVVGLTVTLTHTVGVLGLGLAVTLSTSLAGEAVTRDLTVVSGLLVAVIGGGLLLTTIRDRTPGHARHEHGGHSHGAHGHGHGHGHRTPGTGQRLLPLPRPSREAPALARLAVAAAPPRDGEPRRLIAAPPRWTPDAGPAGGDDHEPEHEPEHDHGDGHGDGHGRNTDPRRGVSRAGLVGMGVAGGLVPSPSALVVLLGAAALGRTVFGVLLVFGYGIGMAATLVAAGLLLVRVRRRFDLRAPARPMAAAGAVGRLMPYATACLVLAVGLALAARGLALQV
jgi:ABC-type nickel/cobalt efflux system permease component RcnA